MLCTAPQSLGTPEGHLGNRGTSQGCSEASRQLWSRERLGGLTQDFSCPCSPPSEQQEKEKEEKEKEGEGGEEEKEEEEQEEEKKEKEKEEEEEKEEVEEEQEE